MEKHGKENAAAAAAGEPEIKYRGIKAMPFVIGNESFEKLGTIGTSTNLIVYLTVVFNLSSIRATTVINVFNGTANFATLLGAYLCDTYFGRYKTLGFASISSFLGMLLLTLTAAISKLHPPHCGADSICIGPTTWQMAFLISGLGLLVIGAGGIRPCNLAFGADQFNPNTESGKRGISSFFNWYYFTYTSAMMVSLTLIVYVQSDVNWAIGLAIPTFLMLLSCTLFFVGTKIYVRVRPEGTPLKGVVQVIVASFKKRKLESPLQPWNTLYNYFPPKSINSRLPYTDQFRYLDKAAVVTVEDQVSSDGSAADSWRLCSMQSVEEVKCLLRIIPIWASLIVYYTAIVQQQTYVVFQALQSDRHLGSGNFQIPAATYTIFTMIAITIWIPIYDQVIVRAVRKYTKKEGGITVLQKMGIGIVLAIITTLISAIVENHRRVTALTRPIAGIDSARGAISSMSASWLIPQLTLIGLSEAFTLIGHIEFYYKQFPENMRSIGGSLTFVGMALSSYLCSILTSVVHSATEGAATGNWLPNDLNKGRLDYYYYLIASLGVLNLGYFLICAKWYRYKGTKEVLLEIAIDKLPVDKNQT